MTSQKKLDLKYCIKCNELLIDKNWLSYLKPRCNYICTQCFRNYGKQYYKTDLEYSKKQLTRYRSKKSAIIHSYGDFCKKCGEDDYYKLTIYCNNKKEASCKTYNWLYDNVIQKDGYQILCYNCSKPNFHKDKYALLDKSKVINNYGNQCFECKENKIEKLTINYKNNEQIKHHTGVKMYRWLIKNNFPTNLELQILCYNCKHSKWALKKYYCLTGINE